MADVTISYKGSEIASMSATGTKTLLTEGKYCEDDITIDYTAPGGGGVQTAYVTDLYASMVLYYTDANMVTQSGYEIVGQYLPIGTLVFVYNEGPTPFPSQPSGLTQLVSYGSVAKGQYIVYEVTG